MKRFLKIFFGLLGALVLLLVVAGLVLPMIYDTEDLKRTISRQVSVQTGRDLSIDGDLDFSVFPWLAIEVNDLSLSDAEGFGPEPMAQIGQARIGVALMPLLRKELVVDEVLLSRMDLKLSVNSSGRSNWDDLAGDGSEAASGEDGTSFSTQRIAGLNIDGATIEYRNEQDGSHYRLSDLDVKTGELGSSGPVPLSVSMALEDIAGGTRHDLSLAADATLDVEAQTYTLDNLELDSNALSLQAPSLRANLAAGTLALNSFTANIGGVEANGGLQASDIQGKFDFSGMLEMPPFNPADLMEALGMQPPETTDPSVFQRASLDATFSGTADQVSLRDLVLVLDDSQFNGRADLRNSTVPVIRFDLAVDEIDADRYMAPADESASPAGDGEAVDIPSESLRDIDVDGHVRITALRFSGLDLSDAEVGIRVHNSKLRIHPLTAGFYGGRYNGDVGIDASGAVPVVTADEKLESVVFQQVASELLGYDNVSGTALGHIKVNGQGMNTDEVLSSLAGSVGMNLTEGALEGIDVWYEIRKAMAQIKGKPAPQDNQGRTVFSRLNMDANINDGILIMQELVGELPFLNLDGNGTIDIARQTLDLGLVASVRNVPELSQDPLASDLKGRSIPLKISGALADPKISVDLEGLLKSEATNILLDKVLGSSDDGAAEDGDAEPQSKSDRNKDAVRGLLKGVLGGSKDEKDDGDD